MRKLLSELERVLLRLGKIFRRIGARIRYWWQRLPRLLAGDFAEPGRSVVTPTGPAPIWPRPDSFSSRVGRVPEASRPPDHPVLDQLRRRAVNELFHWLGLDQIPRQVWPILDNLRDPGLAVARFAETLGCNPLLIRRRDTGEIEQLRLGIRSLIALNALRAKLTRSERREFELTIFQRDHDTIKRRIIELQH